MNVKQIMSSPVTTVPDSADAEMVAHTMLEHRIGSAVVVDRRGHCKGIVTEWDLVARDPANPFIPNKRAVLGGLPLTQDLAQQYVDLRRTPVHKIMATNLITVDVDDPVEKAANLMVRYNVAHLPVLHRGKPVGMVARMDMLRLMLKGGRTARPRPTSKARGETNAGRVSYAKSR